MGFRRLHRPALHHLREAALVVQFVHQFEGRHDHPGGNLLPAMRGRRTPRRWAARGRCRAPRLPGPGRRSSRPGRGAARAGGGSRGWRWRNGSPASAGSRRRSPASRRRGRRAPIPGRRGRGRPISIHAWHQNVHVRPSGGLQADAAALHAGCRRLPVGEDEFRRDDIEALPELVQLGGDARDGLVAVAFRQQADGEFACPSGPGRIPAPPGRRTAWRGGTGPGRWPRRGRRAGRAARAPRRRGPRRRRWRARRGRRGRAYRAPAARR
jgi:hypothetical protein